MLAKINMLVHQQSIKIIAVLGFGVDLIPVEAVYKWVFYAVAIAKLLLELYKDFKNINNNGHDQN